jgi:hypothetical protein
MNKWYDLTEKDRKKIKQKEMWLQKLRDKQLKTKTNE